MPQKTPPKEEEEEFKKIAKAPQATTAQPDSAGRFTEASPTAAKSEWRPYRDLMFYEPLMLLGLLVVKLRSFKLPTDALHKHPGAHQNSAVTPNSFTFNERTLHIAHIAGGPHTVSKGALQKTLELSAILSGFLNSSYQLKPRTVVFNPARREEVFVPFSFPNPSDPEQSTALYMRPWLSKPTPNFKFNGFDRFVTVGCMFGATLFGRDQLSAKIPLIKHFSQFHQGQVIESVSCDASSNPYEASLYQSLRQLAHFMGNFSSPASKKNLWFHSPSYDYMLFGVELYLRGRITKEAFGQFCKYIIEKTIECRKTIQAICDEYDIKLTIFSPFTSLFKYIELNTSDEQSDEAYGTRILRALLPEALQGLIEAPREPNYEYNAIPASCLQNEAMLVAHWLTLLSKETSETTTEALLSTVWADFIKANSMLIGKASNEEDAKKLQITTIETLFRIANATMIAYAAKGTKPYTTCSWLPLSEKPIAATHGKYAETLNAINPSHVPTVNITTLDLATVYSPTTHGPMFYVDEATAALTDMITDPEIQEQISSNIQSLLFKPTSLDRPEPLAQPQLSQAEKMLLKKAEKAEKARKNLPRQSKDKDKDKDSGCVSGTPPNNYTLMTSAQHKQSQERQRTSVSPDSLVQEQPTTTLGGPG